MNNPKNVTKELISKFKKLIDDLPEDLTEDEKTILSLAIIAKLRHSTLLTQIFDGARRKDVVQQQIDAVLSTVLGPGNALTQHGICRTLSARFSAAHLTRIGEVIRTFNEDLKANCGVECFITSGTLLGIIRSGKIIPHDDDFDLAYISKFEKRKDIVSERRTIYQFLKSHPIYKCKAREKHFTLEFNRDNLRFYFDLFPAWVSEGKFSEVPLQPEALAAEEILPLRSVDFYGVAVPAPRNPEALLEINYGPDWRSPDPSFRFDFSQYAAHYWFLHEDFKKGGFDDQEIHEGTL